MCKDHNCNLSRPPSPLPKDTEIRVHELANACEPMKDPTKGETSLMLISSDTILPAVQCGGEAGVNSGESPTILHTSHMYIFLYLYTFFCVGTQAFVLALSVAARRASGKSGYEHLSIPQTTFLPSCLSQGDQVMGRYVSCLIHSLNDN